MKKLFLILIFWATSMLHADAYVSLYNGNYLNSLLSDTVFMNNQISSTNYTYMLSANDAKSAASGLPYYPQGWGKFKIYMPAGLASMRINVITYPNSTLRYHTTLITDPTYTLVNHHTPQFAFSVIPNTTTENVTVSVAQFNFTYTQSSGWIYFDIVHDNANNYDENPNYTGTVTCSINIQQRKSDDVAFERWRTNTLFITPGGDPSALNSTMNIIDVWTPDTPTQRSISLDYNGAPPEPVVSVTGISPISAIKLIPATFTVTGSNLPSTLAFSLTDATCNQTGTPSATSIDFSCTPQVSGVKTYSISNNGTSLKSGIISVSDIDPVNTPITGISPTSAIKLIPTTFTVTGSNLPSALSLTINGADCNQTSHSAESVEFSCIAQVAGTQEYSIKNELNESLRYGFITISEQAASSSSTSNTCPTGSIYSPVDGFCVPIGIGGTTSSSSSTTLNSSASSSPTCNSTGLPNPLLPPCASSASSSSNSSTSNTCPTGSVYSPSDGFCVPIGIGGTTSSSSSSSASTLSTTTMTLQPRWNLISLPIETNDEVDVNKTLNGKATIAYKFKYIDTNETTDTWEKWLPSNTTKMVLKNGEGLFAGVDGSATQTLSFSANADTNVTKFEDNAYIINRWYLLGFSYPLPLSDIKTKYPISVVWTMENGAYKYLDDNATIITPNQGFWFKFK